MADEPDRGFVFGTLATEQRPIDLESYVMFIIFSTEISFRVNAPSCFHSGGDARLMMSLPNSLESCEFIECPSLSERPYLCEYILRESSED